jgi:hypothetical protein
MKSLLPVSLVVTLLLSINIQAEELQMMSAQEQEEAWDFGVGMRFNYLKLTGGFTAYDANTGNTYDLDYKTIGMSNYAPSAALALAGKYGKWNLFFGASRGTYTGSFVTKQDLTVKDETILAGSQVDGKISMGIYSLSTTYALAKEPEYDVGVGFGILLLNMGTEFTSADTTLGGDNFFPMPFAALSGRKKFGKFRISGVGGGAYFNGEKDGLDYRVYYYTFDAKAGYEFYKKENYTAVASLGYRHLYMDSQASQSDGSWFEEKDRYAGPFFSVLLRYTAFK